ncbi:hypothetical protein [Actinoplanes sp. NPDC051494]|uniref:hypothetical protein n=1 Tax=Actinoplanes sp. NPDC051494 TaxID=3363907 RepID=UPI00378969B6
MIGLVLAMVWRRRGQAAALALLALLAVTAAVAAPAYLRSADRAVAAGQAASATTGERSVSLIKTEDDRVSAGSGGADNLSFTSIGPALLALPGFTDVYSAEFPTVGIEPDDHYRTRLVYRQDFCPHLTMVTGRCAVSVGEVVLGELTAKRLKVAAGDRITLSYAKFSPNPSTPVYFADGEQRSLTVAGTYTVPDPSARYWGTHGYFAADPGDRPGEPVFVAYATLTGMDHGSTLKSVDSTAGPNALDVDNLEAVRTSLAELKALTVKLGTSVTVRTELPNLFARVDSGRAAARLIVPVIAVPLVVLSCFVIFLAAGYGAEARRPELAVVALRGVRWWERWLLATGENLLAILAGAIVGCLTGQLLVNTMAAVLFPGVGAAAGFDSLRYAPFAALAALLAALLAQRRELFAPVAGLLRRVPGTRRRPPVLEIAAVLLAVVTGLQLSASGDPAGAGLFAPALIVFAVALVVARAVLPVVTRLSAAALRRGHLGPALAGLRLSRRPGAAGLCALLVGAVGVATYAACAVDSGTQDRAVAAGLGTGAARVLEVESSTPGQLLAATRAVDPEGRFAMAVTRTPGNATGENPGLAVDSTRLAEVAIWPAGAGPTAQEVATALRPPAPDPILITGRDLSVETRASGTRTTAPLFLTVALTSVTGRGSVRVSLGEVGYGSSSYAQRVPICADTCRVDGFQFTSISNNIDVQGHVVVTRLGSINPRVDAVPAEQLADPARWRLPRFGTLAAERDGLGIDLRAPNGLGDTGAWLQPVDSPSPLPVVAAGPNRTSFTGLDGRATDATLVAELPAVPRLGIRASLIDLEYADRLATQSSPASNPEIWLSDAAPADVLDRVAAQGLVVTGDIRAGQVHDQLDKQGAGLALWFYVLAGCLAIALAAGALVLSAAVDSGRRAEDLTALRDQGLDRRSAGQAALWAYPMLVALSVLAGTGTGLAGYALTGWTLPLAGLDPPPLPLPLWPRPGVIALVAAAVLVVLVGVSLLTSRNPGKDNR